MDELPLVRLLIRRLVTSFCAPVVWMQNQVDLSILRNNLWVFVSEVEFYGVDPAWLMSLPPSY